MSDDKKKFSELVLAERAKGNVVFLAIDQVMSMPVKDIIKQPADGLLWDLNRDEATALSFMDEEGMIHWVNNFAVALVIKELKRQLDEALTENAALKRGIAKYKPDHEWSCVSTHDKGDPCDCGFDEFMLLTAEEQANELPTD